MSKLRRGRDRSPGDPREPLLGRPPTTDEADRPPEGRSVSQAHPGASGPHANPVHPRERRQLGEPPALNPMEGNPVASDMPPIGAWVPTPDDVTPVLIPPPHPPGPPYEETDRRVAQRDWEHWRAADRRKVPFSYPDWRT